MLNKGEKVKLQTNNKQLPKREGDDRNESRD